MNDDAELVALADGVNDLIVLSDGQLLHTHGPARCLGPFCCIHNPSDHPLRAAPMIWVDEPVQMIMRVCVHESVHPDPDSFEFRQMLALAGRVAPYDGWHPCCAAQCCREPDPVETDYGTTESAMSTSATFRWFGEPWGAPACEPRLRIDVPVGSACVSCSASIDGDDNGVRVPVIGGSFSHWHRACFLSNIGVSDV